MRTHVVALLGFVPLFFSIVLYAEEAKKDTELIQGQWAAATYIQDGQGEGETIDPKESPIRWEFKENKVMACLPRNVPRVMRVS